MGARQKLNGSYFNGSVLLAALIGGALDSWLAFGVALAVLVTLNLAAGEIRPRSRNRHLHDGP